MFSSSMQGNHESVENYEAMLKNLSLTCGFGSLSEDLIEEWLLIGLSNDVIREKLLLESNLTLKKAVELARLAKQTTKGLES